jgi:hypothetical protein
MKKCIFTLILLMIVADASAGVLLSGGYFKPSGDWARDRYNGGVSLGLSGEWPLDPHFALVIPQFNYSELGMDHLLPDFMMENYGIDISPYGKMASTMWYAGGGVKGILFPEAYVTPTLGVGYAYFSRGVTLNGRALPFIPGIPQIPTSARADGGGFLVTYGIKFANPVNLSFELEFRNFWAKGVGNSEIDQFLEIPEQNAQGLIMLGSIEFF